MLFKLREVFKKFVDAASNLLYSKDKLIELIDQFKYELVCRDVAYDVADDIAQKLALDVKNGLIKNRDALVKRLREVLLSYFDGVPRVDLELLARTEKPLKVIFMGVNGVGKTTTIAKVAVYLREKGYRPIMIAADTFRAAAQEQLKKHSEKTGIPLFLGKYGADPASVAYDGVLYGMSRGFNVMLIDTAGRMHTDVDLVNELKKIIRVIKPSLKILVVDALTGNDAIEQAKFFNEAVGVDAFIVAKFDAYEEGGVPLSIVYITKRPVIFVGTGQDYSDLKPFDPLEYVDKLVPVD
ncbi:MAG: signal recognition particle-docking protein FtsY [Desulfurococcaceae archaeon]